MKYFIACLIIAACAFAGFFWFNDHVNKKKQVYGATDYLDAEYVIEGERIRLQDGVAETEIAPGNASHTITRYFGNRAKGDLNGDSVPDLAFLLTQESGGTGTFVYVAVALQNINGTYTGTNAVFLGDRIAPQTTEIRDSQVIVNYAERAKGDPMTAQPREGVSKYLHVVNNTLLEVE